MDKDILTPDASWARRSPAEAITYIVMILQVQLLKGFERFDFREADENCQACFENWLLNLQFRVSYDFANRVYKALVALPLPEALAEVQRLWSENMT